MASSTTMLRAPATRKYGGRFGNGFGQYLRDSTLADVTIVAPDGREHQAHMLLLSYHSEFFKRAFSADFKEKEERRVSLGFEDPAGVWPLLLEFFYTDEIVLTDETVLPLLAMSRELMVKSIEEYCSDYAQNSLEASNAIQYLNQAVQFNCDSFRQSCVALVAEGFPSSFNKPTDGLPSEVMLEVLTHPHLVVQTEEQVLTFVLNYVPRHELPPEVVRQLYEQVRFPFLSNERLASLAQEETVPKDMLLTAMAMRFALLDRPERLAAVVAFAQPSLPTPSSSSAAAAYNPAAALGSLTSPAAGPGGPPSPLTLPPRPTTTGAATSSSSGQPPVHQRQHSVHWAATPPSLSGATDSATAAAMAAAGIPMPAPPPPPPHRVSTPGNVTPSGNSQQQQGAGLSGTLPPPLTLPLPPMISSFAAAQQQGGGGAAAAALAAAGVAAGLLTTAGLPLPPSSLVPRKTYVCTVEYGMPGGSEYACVPLHEVWEDLVPQLHVRVSGDVVEGDPQSILRVSDSDTSWFMVSGDSGAQIWIEVELPSNMRVVELTKYTFSHGMNFATHMFPYGISDSAWFQMKGLCTQVGEGDSDLLYSLRTSESTSTSMQFEYTITVDTGPGAPRTPSWRRLRITANEEQSSSGVVRLSVRKLRLFGRVEISLTREGPAGARDVLGNWRRRKELAAARQQQTTTRKSMAASLAGLS